MQYHAVSELFTNNFSILFVETKLNTRRLEEREGREREREEREAEREGQRETEGERDYIKCK
jgi:hypothetical protein